MLQARNLEHRYGARTVLAVDDLLLEPGSITAFVGPNGSGKSTLLRVLAFVERPAAGTLRLADTDIRTEAERRRARRRVTLVEQQPFLFRGTAGANLAYALGLHGVRGPGAAARMARALERVGMGAYAARQARDLSQGEAQRLAVARALALEPDVLLLDEPVSATDRAATAELYAVLDDERRRGAVVAFASHQLEDAYRWSDRQLALADGRLTQATPENMFRVVVPPGTGARVVKAGPLEVHVVTDHVGPATLVIPPSDIVVSRGPLDSSLRNQFAGRVIRIADDGKGGVTITADVGVELVARVTRAALDELQVTLGTAAVFSVKAMAVRVL